MNKLRHTSALIVIALLSWVPWLLGTLQVQGGLGAGSVSQAQIAASAVGTAQLKTATGQFTSTDTNGVKTVVMNDYAFFPMTLFYNTASGGYAIFTNTSNSGDITTTVGQFQINSTGSGTQNIDARWRYVTASDNPYWWVCRNTLGAIVATWISDDPPSPTFTGSPASFPNEPLIVCQQVKSGDLQAWSIPSWAYTLGDAWIASKGYSTANRNFRAFQQYVGSQSPGLWMQSNLQVIGGVLGVKAGVVLQ